MSTVTVSKARSAFSDLLNAAQFRGERIIVHRNGKPAAAMISIEDLELLQQLEDRMDLDAARAALAQGDTRPFEEFARELGL